MVYSDICEGIFIKRINRFTALVEVDGRMEKAHVMNTGRCRELFVEGAKVFLKDHISAMGSRKLRYTLITVEKTTDRGRLLVNMDSVAPNRTAADALMEGRIAVEGFEDITLLKREHRYGASRIDIYMESGERRALIEVKSVTLEDGGTARFPDAPTERGIKHIEELMGAVKEGYDASIFFIVQIEGMKEFTPNRETHPEFADALAEAVKTGVHVRAFDCTVGRDSLAVDREIPVII